jgi:hypothetical protein
MERAKMNTVYMCVLCDKEITNNSHCIGCNEYKSAMEYSEWVTFNAENPRKVAA